MYLYSAFNKTNCFKVLSLQKNHDINVIISSCLIITFSRLKLGDNIIKRALMGIFSDIILQMRLMLRFGDTKTSIFV